MNPRSLLLALIGLLFAFALASQVPYTLWLLHLEAHSREYVQVPFSQESGSRAIDQVFNPYQTVGLSKGDQVISLNGNRIEGTEDLMRVWHTAKPDHSITVSVRRNNTESKDFTFSLKPAVSNFLNWPMMLLLTIILPFSCLLVGFYIGFARPTDRLAWITMAMLASFSQALGTAPSLLASPWREFFIVFHGSLGVTWPIWMFLFGLYFPLPFAFLKRQPWIPWLVATPSLVMAALEVYCNFERLHHIDRVAWVRQLITPEVIWDVTLVFAFLGCLRIKRRLMTNPDARRRLRIMILGSSYALLPILPVVASQVLHWIPPLPEWLTAICSAMLILFPVTMRYVIITQQAMDVRIVIRSGVRYAFASQGIKVFRVLLLSAVVIGTFELAQQREHQLESIAIGGIGAILVLSIRQLSEWMLRWMDRRFFREAYNADRILTELSSTVAGIRDVRELLETVSHRISESLHVPAIAVFLEQNGAYRPAFAIGSTMPPEALELKPAANIVQFLKRQGGPSRVYFADPQSWVHGAPQPEQSVLRQLGTQVLLPLSLKNRLLGMISLGGKRSEEPYSRADLQLLGAVASQTGLALENAELTESVRRQIAQRERLDRELEIAREVQQRLFPQKLPVVSGLDFAGYCRPAEGVGGDYYDFIHLPDSSLGIAVGDVSGKGIAAALMMASLQASLRGQTIKPCETLSEMIHNVNGLMYEASADNHYATFFYAQYHPETRAMRYVNAGHNPPIVWRKVGDQHKFLRLEDGGTVVGLFRSFPFCEAVVQLQRGDVLVAFTDGISEAMNASEEEFEEERLMEALQSIEARTAAEMISQLLVEVDQFTAGAKQHDDMTLVIVRVQ